MSITCPTPSRDFVTIDVEYADSEQNICQVGLAEVKNLQIVTSRSWLIQPPCNYYEEHYIRKHHITPDDTENAGFFDQVWQEIQPCLLPHQLWAHNAISVEQPVLVKNITMCGYDASWLEIFDSRDLYKRPDCSANSGNGLPQCCMALGIPFDTKQHHDAEYDAIKCAEIIIAYAKGQQPDWNGVPKNSEELRKQLQEKRILRLGDFQAYYANNTSGDEDVIAVLTSTDGCNIEQVIDVFDKGDRLPGENSGRIDFSRLNTGENNPLYGKKVVLTGIFNIERREIERAIEAMGAKKVPKPTKVTDAIILGTQNVGFTKLIAIEEQEIKGHHIARIIGDADLEVLLYGEGQKFFKE